MLPDQSEEVYSAAEGIGIYLTKHLLCHQGFACENFYAEAFALPLLYSLNLLHPEIYSILSESFRKKNRKAADFHWEFNRYGLKEFQDLSGESRYNEFIENSSFTGNSTTNWSLLRYRLLLSLDTFDHKTCQNVKELITSRQDSEGLLWDESGVRSFQYHSFSLAILLEIAEMSKDSFFLDAAKRGIDFISRFVLRNGDTLYVGRGQQQLFGYASIIYALAKFMQLRQEYSHLYEWGSIWRFIQGERRNNGSFPLVLGRDEPDQPFEPNLKNPDYLGWYAYNRYFDYLTFAGYFFLKTARILPLSQTNNGGQNFYREKDSFSGSWIKVTKKSYEAVLNKPYGVTTNDLVFPYIVYRGQNITPCNGGELIHPSLYSKNDISLPFFKRINRTIKAKSISWLTKNTLKILSPCGFLKRRFTFLEDQIQVKTSLFSPFSSTHQYIFHDTLSQQDPYTLVGNKFRIHSNTTLKLLRKGYNCQGGVQVYGAKGFHHVMTIRFET
ncbi:MAG: hypothetical protein Tsb0021_05000 [Chlamydiales bacterium]